MKKIIASRLISFFFFFVLALFFSNFALGQTEGKPLILQVI